MEEIQSASVTRHSLLLVSSFFHWTKNHLIDPKISVQDIPDVLYYADFALVSHGVEADPVFNYANQKAQDLWKLSWKEFIKMPSRLSAEKIEQSEREKLLKEANEKGYISNYTGVRISSKGERFLIKDTILWNVVDEEGNYKGQAAMFYNWEYLK